MELPPGSDTLALRQRAMAAGVSLAPGPMFSARGDFRNCLRINYGHPYGPRVAGALKQVGRMARELPV